MYAIQGKVIVKGSGAGVPDLVVVAYDVDPRQQQQSSTTAPRPIDDDLRATLASGAMRTWVDFPGDRLGSVLTDERGRFRLELNDDEFRKSNVERWPDLILFVMAPSQAESKTSVYGGERLLHASLLVRANAGRLESWCVALEPELLQQHGIRLPGDHHRVSSQALFLDAETRKAELRAAQRARTDAAAPRLTAIKALRPNFWKAFKPRDLVVDQFFVAPGTAVADMSRRVFEEAVTRLRAYRGKARLRLLPDQVRRLGATPESLAAGTTVPINMCDALAEAKLGPALGRVRTLLDDLRARDAEARLEPAEPTPTPGGGGPTTVPETSDAVAVIRDRVLGQISDLPSEQREKGKSAIESLEHIKKTLDALEISGGPANVPAFRDVHSLQVAFKHVWTLALDGRAMSQVEQLADAANQLHEELGLPVPSTAYEDVQAFREYINEIKGALPYASNVPMPDAVAVAFPDLSELQWTKLDVVGQRILEERARHQGAFARTIGGVIARPPDAVEPYETNAQLLQRVLTTHTVTTVARVEKLISDLSDRLVEPYAFHLFQPYSVNFGILTTYRQQWIPQAYQVGRLVSTIPLAPGEKRSFKVKQTVKRSRAEKEARKASTERADDRQEIGRSESDAMDKSQASTNFRLAASGSLSMGIGSVSSSTEFSAGQANEAARTKKALNESTRKSAEKVRQERETLVELTSTEEAQTEATHEISNPNNELTVTYLLYELERRFLLSTALHEVRPVVLVALDVPMPHEITETWILEHAWILKRALLDEGLRDAFEYIENGAVVADAMDIEVKKVNWSTQKTLVDRLEHHLGGLLALRDARRQEMIKLRERVDRYKAGDDTGQDVAAAIFSGGLSLLFSGSPDQAALLEAQRKTVEQTLAYMAEEIDDLQSRLSRAQSALQEATSAYTAAMKDRERARALVGQAVLHFRQNILHYMHAVWDATHPDQRYFELYHRQVEVIEPATTTCRLRRATAEEQADPGVPTLRRDGDAYVVECLPLEPPAPGSRVRTAIKTLVEIADLDNPLGFKGNYVIFPLKTCTYITDFMMQEYVDDYFGVRDPSDPDGFTVPELLRYAAALLNDRSRPLSAEEEQALKRLVMRKLSHASLDSDTVVVPTGNLYMEALKGDQALLEDFKLAHRGLDMLKVQEEVRAARLENLRRAARLTQSTPQLEQPSADKVVLVQGAGHVSLPVVE